MYGASGIKSSEANKPLTSIGPAIMGLSLSAFSSSHANCLTLALSFHLNQGSQTGSPGAICGPRDDILWPPP